MMTAMPILFALILIPLVIFGFVFWIKTLIEVLTKEPSEGNDKIVWLLVVIFFHFIGCLIYHFVRRPERLRLYGK